MLSKDRKSEIIKEHATSKDDVGSAPVQIALLTARINELTEHMKEHRHDFHTERGLQMMVGKRRRLLDYLAREDEKAYGELIKKLKLRK